jgi:hypothetical protein
MAENGIVMNNGRKVSVAMRLFGKGLGVGSCDAIITICA